MRSVGGQGNERMRNWSGLWRDRRGITSFEYALIGSLIFLVIVAAVSATGNNLATTFNIIANGI
jgi:pilus assembly protein Flp/PilA